MVPSSIHPLERLASATTPSFHSGLAGVAQERRRSTSPSRMYRRGGAATRPPGPGGGGRPPPPPGRHGGGGPPPGSPAPVGRDARVCGPRVTPVVPPDTPPASSATSTAVPRTRQSMTPPARSDAHRRGGRVAAAHRLIG